MPDKIRIMIVDDDQDILLLFKTFLEPRFEIFLFQDGDEALRRVDEIRPNIFLIDVMMKEMNGYQLLEHIRAMPEYRRTPVLMLSGAVKPENIREGYNRGATVYLCKPFSPENILKFIERQVDNLVTHRSNDDFIRDHSLQSCD